MSILDKIEKWMDEIGEGIKVIAIFVGAFAAIVIGQGIIVLWLWNALMPDLFRLSEITVWQAIGLTWLCSMLFKSYHQPKKDN
jgi:hypothetical protein